MFWGFLVKLLVWSWIAPYLLAAVMLPVMVALKHTSPAYAPARLANEAVQCVFWAGWAAFCVLSARTAVASPDVRHWLVYYAVAAVAAVVPVAHLTRRARAAARTREDRQFIATATTRYWSVCLLAFSAFCLSPEIARNLFGWLPGF